VSFETQARIDVLMKAQDGICGICRKVVPPMHRRRDRLSHPLRPTIDHVRPQGLRGDDAWGNIVVAHSRCNGDKGSRWPTEDELAFLADVNAKIPHLLREAA
jgi:5-methylcytosine-specific restriction endonuclease McrA